MTLPWSGMVLGACGLARQDSRWMRVVSIGITLQYVTDAIDGKVGRIRGAGLVRWGDARAGGVRRLHGQRFSGTQRHRQRYSGVSRISRVRATGARAGRDAATRAIACSDTAR
jgi:hypothetical protein